MTQRGDKRRRPWHLYVLALAAVAVAGLAIAELGPPSSSARASREIVTAEQGVVQSTVTGTGNVEAGSDVNVNFNTSGTLQNVYVSAGQKVSEGQLLATLDLTSEQLALDQANESLTAAQDHLTAIENGTATASGSGSPSGGAGSVSSATNASLRGDSTGGELLV